MSLDRTRDRLALGACCVIGAAVMFSLAGVSIKMASSHLSNETIVFWRNAISTAILLPWALRHRRAWFRTHNMRLIVMRAVTILGALYCYIYAISAIPLADAVLLNFCSPIFVPLLGFAVFRFALDKAVSIAVLVGFLGVALVLQPGAGTFQPAALIGLLGGALGALSVVAIWRMPGAEHPGRIAFFFGLIGAAVAAVPAALLGEWPSGGDWLPLLMLGVFSTAAHLLFALGCLVAPADRVVTLDYTTVLFASGLGWLIWGERPDAFLILGGGLIVAAGIYVTRARRPPPSPPQARRMSPALGVSRPVSP